VTQYTDDLGIYLSERNTNYARFKLQNQLSRLEGWCTDWHIKLNGSKTKLLIITKRVILTNNFKGTMVNRVLGADLLGVCFDSCLTFKPHISSKLNIEFLNRLNFLDVIKSLGANLNSLIFLYKILIRPLLASGYCALYRRNSALEQLERMHPQDHWHQPMDPSQHSQTRNWHPPISAYIHDQLDKAIVRFGQSALLDELETLRCLYPCP
jgi:hypothetical protein